MRDESKVAVVAGSTGLIGSHVLRLLAAAPEYGRIVALARRPLGVQYARTEQRAADFEHLNTVLRDLRSGGAIDVFCCLGTTIKTAGSEAAFRRVDHDYVIALARWAQRATARRFLLVSALGADAGSRVFYNRVKGETENALRAMSLPSLVIAQPSLLDGDRAELRIGERLAIIATRPLRALIPARVRPVRAEDVAAALLLAAREASPPPTLASAQMQDAMQRLDRET